MSALSVRPLQFAKKMASKSSYRPRRTRIYGANYDIGESYYKKQLDDLDNKRGMGSRLTDQYMQSDISRNDELKPKVSFMQDNDDDRFKFTPTLRRKPLKFDDDDDEIFNSSLKPYVSKYSAADDSSYAENAKSDILKRVLGTPARETSFHNELDDQMHGSSFSSRKLKLKSESYLAEDSSVETSSRMKATRARLADLESEILSQNEKQSEREKRKHNLRKLLNESTSDAFPALEDM